MRFDFSGLLVAFLALGCGDSDKAESDLGSDGWADSGLTAPASPFSGEDDDDDADVDAGNGDGDDDGPPDIDDGSSDMDGSSDVDDGSSDADGIGDDPDDDSGSDLDTDADAVDDTGSAEVDADTDADGGTDDTGGSDADGGTDTGSGTDDGGTDDGGTDGGATFGDTIMDVQTHVIASGTEVTLGNVVVSSPPFDWPDAFFIADPAGGPNSGLWVYADWLDDEDSLSFTVGERITVTGTVSEAGPDGGTDFETKTQIRIGSSSDIVIESMGTEPAPEEIDVATLTVLADAEPWESVLVSIDDPTLTTRDDGKLTIGDGIVVADDFMDLDGYRGGDTFSRLVGIANFSDGAYEVVPRTSADLVGHVVAAESCSADKCVSALVEGDLVISEIMPQPAACDSSTHAGEYIELYNNTDGSIDLIGLDIRDAADRSDYVRESTVVASHEYAVLEYREDEPCLGDAVASVASTTYRSVQLNNTGDTVYVGYGGTTFDSVAYESDWPFSEGVSMQFNMGTASPPLHESNNDKGNWCAANSAIAGAWTTPDMGTPGSATVCGGPVVP
jgi:hypothetical protein